MLDTNVASEARRRGGDAAVQRWVDSTPASAKFLSVLVLGEVRRGIQRLRARDAVQAAVFEGWLERLRVEFGRRVLPVTVEIADAWDV